jgi:hypothetical protein
MLARRLDVETIQKHSNDRGWRDGCGYINLFSAALLSSLSKHAFLFHIFKNALLEPMFSSPFQKNNTTIAYVFFSRASSELSKYIMRRLYGVRKRTRFS